MEQVNKKLFLILNIVLVTLILIGTFIYFTNKALLIKSLTSAGFVILGIVNFLYVFLTKGEYKKFATIMLIGLCFAMLGDIILEIEFIIGAILFAIGHIFYFISYCQILKFKPTDLIIGGIIFVLSASVILFAPVFNFEGIIMEIVCIIYALIISLMVGKAVTNFIQQKNIVTLVAMIGSILFLISDLVLLFNNFSTIRIPYLCIATYYPAQCLLAITIILTTLLEQKNTDKQ